MSDNDKNKEIENEDINFENDDLDLDSIDEEEDIDFDALFKNEEDDNEEEESLSIDESLSDEDEDFDSLLADIEEEENEENFSNELEGDDELDLGDIDDEEHVLDDNKDIVDNEDGSKIEDVDSEVDNVFEEDEESLNEAQVDNNSEEVSLDKEDELILEDEDKVSDNSEEEEVSFGNEEDELDIEDGSSLDDEDGSFSASDELEENESEDFLDLEDSLDEESSGSFLEEVSDTSELDFEDDGEINSEFDDGLLDESLEEDDEILNDDNFNSDVDEIDDLLGEEDLELGDDNSENNKSDVDSLESLDLTEKEVDKNQEKKKVAKSKKSTVKSKKSPSGGSNKFVIGGVFVAIIAAGGYGAFNYFSQEDAVVIGNKEERRVKSTKPDNIDDFMNSRQQNINSDVSNVKEKKAPVVQEKPSVQNKEYVDIDVYNSLKDEVESLRVQLSNSKKEFDEDVDSVYKDLKSEQEDIMKKLEGVSSEKISEIDKKLANEYDPKLESLAKASIYQIKMKKEQEKLINDMEEKFDKKYQMLAKVNNTNSFIELENRLNEISKTIEALNIDELKNNDENLENLIKEQNQLIMKLSKDLEDSKDKIDMNSRDYIKLSKDFTNVKNSNIPTPSEIVNNEKGEDIKNEKEEQITEVRESGSKNPINIVIGGNSINSSDKEEVVVDKPVYKVMGFLSDRVYLINKDNKDFKIVEGDYLPGYGRVIDIRYGDKKIMTESGFVNIKI